ncbi:hypothetical protein D3C79_759340 [compost metagenome]
MGVVGGRDELGLAHGAGPRATHGLRLDVAMLDDLQRSDQLVLGELRAAALIGQGSQRADHRLVALELAEVAFHAPYRDQHLAIDAIALLDAGQQFGVLLQQLLAVAYTQGRQGAFEVFPYWAGEFRLAAIGLDHVHVGGDAEEGAVEGVLRNAGLQGLLAKACLPLCEGLQRLDFSTGVERRAGQGHHRGGLGGGQRQGIGGGGLFCAGHEQDETGGRDQLTGFPAGEKTEEHSQIQNCRSGDDHTMPALSMLSCSQKVGSLPISRLEGFAAVAAFALVRLFLTAAEQRLGDDRLGLVGAVLFRLFAHGGVPGLGGFRGAL